MDNEPMTNKRAAAIGAEHGDKDARAYAREERLDDGGDADAWAAAAEVVADIAGIPVAVRDAYCAAYAAAAARVCAGGGA